MGRLRKEARVDSGIAPFKFVDLFAGIGGFHRALRDLGGHCILACEIDPTCRRFYQYQFPETDKIVENIREITRVDLADPASTRSTT
ncbi:MAG: DNA cytosine methyltransferase, partial [Alphaproteobacteria bacterium]